MNWNIATWRTAMMDRPNEKCHRFAWKTRFVGSQSDEKSWFVLNWVKKLGKINMGTRSSECTVRKLETNTRCCVVRASVLFFNLNFSVQSLFLASTSHLTWFTTKRKKKPHWFCFQIAVNSGESHVYGRRAPHWRTYGKALGIIRRAIFRGICTL